MSRIPGVPPKQAGWLLKFANRYALKKVGKVLEPAAVMGHHPWILGGNGAFEMALERSSRVPDGLKALAGIKAAMLIGCPF